ncbi:hypothetical protein PMT97_08605 [Enterococcus faecalis]|uniref:hypothetical protein n=1 Tax=Enterococcus faecalis TaxID=1351 RepID=UPI000DEBCEAB|nr:hypothetical protein [Enterococcus faecalis]EGO9002138.1 hypothetical protein [Enterococcus faecalis]MDB1624165.1 hypothetical protein [Enterococcus faecalis]TQB29444.1 hypothetical protein FKZ00_09920 [Enterococcus faecalis]
MLFNFWRISAYFRSSWFCSRRLSGFEPGTKIQSDFCPRLFPSEMIFLAVSVSFLCYDNQ